MPSYLLMQFRGQSLNRNKTSLKSDSRLKPLFRPAGVFQFWELCIEIKSLLARSAGGKNIWLSEVKSNLGAGISLKSDKFWNLLPAFQLACQLFLQHPKCFGQFDSRFSIGSRQQQDIRGAVENMTDQIQVGRLVFDIKHGLFFLRKRFVDIRRGFWVNCLVFHLLRLTGGKGNSRGYFLVYYHYGKYFIPNPSLLR